MVPLLLLLLLLPLPLPRLRGVSVVVGVVAPQIFNSHP